MHKDNLFTFSGFFVLVLLASGLYTRGGSPLDERRVCLPLAPSPAIVFAGDRFFLATYHSGAEQVSHKLIFAIYSSPDGKEWTLRTEFRAFPNVATLAYGNHRLVTIADDPMISTNGVNWLTDPSPRPPSQAGRIVFAGDRFVALAAGQVWESRTGFDWQRISTNSFSTLDFLDGRLVATAGSSSTTNGKYPAAIGISVDGRSWDIHRFELDRSFWPAQTAYGDGKFITVGSGASLVFTTPQDVIFHTNRGPASAILYTDKFVSAGNGGLEYSSDGVNWIKANAPLGTQFTKVAYGRGTYVAAGGNNFATSTNGVDWVMHIQDGLGPVAYGNGVFVVGGRLYSRDGRNWAGTDLKQAIGNPVLHFAEGQFLLLHDNGSGHKSTDGIQWVPFDTALEIQAKGLTSLDGRTYTVGWSTNGSQPPILGGVLARSGTNETWETMLRLPETPLHSITAGNGTIVAAGGHFADFTRGTVLVSTNGSEWMNISLPFAGRSIVYGEGKFVLVGDFAGIAVSTNGLDWKTNRLGVQPFKHLNHAAGHFVAFAGSPGNMAVDQKMWSSDDGEEWLLHPTNPGLIVSSAFGQRTWLFVEGVTVMQTAPFVPRIGSQTLRRNSGTFSFAIENRLLDQFLLESSPDLQNWTALTNSAAEKLTFDAPPTDNAKFYRARLP